MPELTPNVGIKKPLGNEYVSRASFNENYDIIDSAFGDHETRLQKIEEEMGEGTPFQTTVLPGMNIITVPRSTPFNVLNIKGRTLVNLLGRLGRTATSATITIDAAKTYLIINEVGTSVTVNGINRNTPCKVTGQTSLNLSWASGSKVAVYEVSSADSAAIDGMTPEQIAQRWPYVDDVKGVRNPYIIRYGKNLLPPFTEWTLHANTKVQSSYELNHTKTTTGTYEASIFRLPAVAGQTYTIAGDIELSGTVGSSGQTATVEIYGFDKNGNYVSHVNNWINENGQSKVSYTVPSNVTHIEGRLTVNANVTGTVTFKNPMLNIGDTPLPFEPQNNDYVFYDVSLHSNIDGTVYDSLFYNGNGQPRKLKRIDEVTVDGSFAVSFGANYTGFKTVSISLPSIALSTGPGVKIAGIKFDGKVLSMDQTEIQSDSWGLLNVTTASISIPDTDSGWPEAWNGTTIAKKGAMTRDATAQDMIKAYFNGWKWDDAAGLWRSVYDSAYTQGDVDYVINNRSSTKVENTPYRLLYQLATPVEIPVTSEGKISLFEGTNVLEVGTGIVRREPVTPVDDPNNPYYFINNLSAGFEAGRLKNRADKILSVYRNEQIDTQRWTRFTNNAYGNEMVRIGDADYNSTAAYSVTYTVLDRYLYTAPLIDLQAEYRTKLAGVVSQLSQDQADIAARLSVVETQYARKRQGQYINLTLLNGWVDYGTGFATAGYMKDEFGFVHIKGMIKSGVTTAGTVIATLPKGCRPKEKREIVTACFSPASVALLSIYPTGDIVADIVPYNTWLSLELKPFLAEQ